MRRSDSLIYEKLGINPIRKICRLEAESWAIFFFGSLPGVIGFVMRWFSAKLFFKKVSGFCFIQPRTIFVNSQEISLDRNFTINSGCYLNGIGGIEIGDEVLIGSNVTISSEQHLTNDFSTSILRQPVKPNRITIESDVWIGAGAVLLPGCHLSRGTVIGANAVVRGRTEVNSVMVENPAKLLRIRGQDIKPGHAKPSS